MKDRENFMNKMACKDLRNDCTITQKQNQEPGSPGKGYTSKGADMRNPETCLRNRSD